MPEDQKPYFSEPKGFAPAFIADEELQQVVHTVQRINSLIGQQDLPEIKHICPEPECDENARFTIIENKIDELSRKIDMIFGIIY